LKDKAMPDNNRPYEPLTSENAALVLVDHQVGLMSGVRDYSIAELKHNVFGLAKAAKAPDRRDYDGPGQHVGTDVSRAG
jgi:hypothetical protein